MRTVIVLAILAALAGTQPSWGQSAGHSMHGAGMRHGPTPVEAGQAGFAAIAEIVAMLEADPKTDWSRVDIEALRRHLVDMNALTLDATAETVVLEDRVVFRVSGEGAALRAIRAMVPAHAAALSEAGAWRATAALTERGADLTIAPADPRDLPKIAALGFIGVMATGAHHQAHHLQIAMGR